MISPLGSSEQILDKYLNTSILCEKQSQKTLEKEWKSESQNRGEPIKAHY